MTEPDVPPRDRRPSLKPRFGVAPIVGILIGLMVLIHLATRVLTLPGGHSIPLYLGFSPQRFTAAMLSGDVPVMAVLPWVTHAFLHVDMAHLLMNMLALAAFGTGVVRRLETVGQGASARFLLLFLLGAVAGAMASYVTGPMSPKILLGASGGISALIGAAFRLQLGPNSQGAPLLPLLSRPVIGAAAAFTLLNVATALGLVAPGMQIAWDAHLGGFALGLLAYPLLERGQRGAPGVQGP